MIQQESSENLRCPRCDSPNTKFCYYNNYNLTQPRHFCKTCRRYWTKGGALRNVPIGGGCRRNKTPTASAAKPKPKPGLFEQTEPLSAHPLLWGSPQNGTHFLSLLGPNQNPSMMVYGSESSTIMDARASGFDPFGPAHLPLPLYRSQTGPGQGINDGLQEVYHRIRSSSAYYPEYAPVIVGSTGASAASGILESSPVAAAAAELGFWNPALSWPAEFPTINAAYP